MNECVEHWIHWSAHVFGEVYCVYSVRILFERFIPKSWWLTGATPTFKGKEGSRWLAAGNSAAQRASLFTSQKTKNKLTITGVFVHLKHNISLNCTCFVLPWHISLCLLVLTADYIIHTYQKMSNNSLGPVKDTKWMGLLLQQQEGQVWGQRKRERKYWNLIRALVQWHPPSARWKEVLAVQKLPSYIPWHYAFSFSKFSHVGVKIHTSLWVFIVERTTTFCLSKEKLHYLSMKDNVHSKTEISAIWWQYHFNPDLCLLARISQQ